MLVLYKVLLLLHLLRRTNLIHLLLLLWELHHLCYIQRLLNSNWSILHWNLWVTRLHIWLITLFRLFTLKLLFSWKIISHSKLWCLLGLVLMNLSLSSIYYWSHWLLRRSLIRLSWEVGLLLREYWLLWLHVISKHSLHEIHHLTRIKLAIIINIKFRWISKWSWAFTLFSLSFLALSSTFFLLRIRNHIFISIWRFTHFFILLSLLYIFCCSYIECLILIYLLLLSMMTFLFLGSTYTLKLFHSLLL